MKLCAFLLLFALAAPDIEYLEGLRERRLYQRAERECLQRLAANELSEADRAELVIQLALTHAAQAVDEPAATRDTKWWQAARVCDEYREIYSDTPRSLLVTLQRALIDIARGEVAQLEAEGMADEAKRLGSANEYIRQGIHLLEEVREAVEKARNGLGPELVAEGGFGEHELASLAGNVALQMGRALSRQAACFPAESPDRDDALLRSLELLKPLAAKLPADDFVWQARLELLACLRQLGRVDDALEQLDTWITAAPSEIYAGELFAERLRLLLAADRVREALKLAEQPPTSPSASADMARLETLIASWQTNPEDKLTEAIHELVAQVRQRNRPATTRRAEAIVGRTFASSPSVDNPHSLLAAADFLCNSGRVDEALATYDRAAAAFAESGNAAERFSAALTAATLEKSRGELSSAVERYRRLALSQPTHELAAAAHQAAILALADQLRDEPAVSDGTAVSLYAELLAEHISTWKDSPTADDARWWQAQFLASQNRLAEALAALAQIATSSEHAQQAVELAGNLYVRLLDLSRRESDQSRELLLHATAHLQPLVLEADQRWPKSWTPLQRSAAIALARLHLQYGPHGQEYAQRMLLSALRGAPPPEPEWRTDAAPLLIVALVRGGQSGEALKWLEQTSGQRASDALALLDALLAELQSAPASQESALAGVLLSAVDRVATGSKNDAEMHSLLVRYRAAALAGLGRDQEALTIYTKLAPQRPRDGDVQEGYARLLGRSDSSAGREQALRQWRAVERGSRQGGPRWFRARLAHIELLKQLGRHDEAAKLLALTRLSHPDLGGEEMRGRFEALQ